MTRTTILLAAGAGTLALFTSCSGGGGGGEGTAETVEGLSAPSTVSVVSADASETGSGSTASGNTVAPGSNSFPVGSEYNTDNARVWVYDPSMEPLAIINSILTDTSNTAYDEMVNYGPYNAQITPTEDRGESQGSESSDTGQSSGAQNESFEIFVVDSTRASNRDSQIAKFWVPDDVAEEGEMMTIYAQMVIAEGATEADPFGQFVLTFAGTSDYANLADPMMRGVLETNEVSGDGIGFSFFETEGDLTASHTPGMESNKVRINVAMSANQETGAAKIVQQFRGNWGMGDTGLQEQTWQVAFNGTHFKRQRDDGDVVTLSRDEYNTTVWRYNLYHAEGDNAGQRVDLNSGFGFQTEDGAHGWVGYHGFWAPDEVTIEDGDTITQENFDGEEGEEYTVLLAPGKLMKHTKNEMDLVDIGTNTFHFWDWEEQIQYMVDYYSGAFWKVAVFDEESHEWEEMDTPEQIDVPALGGWLNMWSDSLGGSVTYIDGADYITFYEEEFVNGSSSLFDDEPEGRVALYGYIDCLDANLSGAEVESGAIFLENSEEIAAPHVFRFDADDLTLYYDADGDDSDPQQVGLAEGEEPEEGPNMWGMHSGPMVLDTSELTDTWDMWNLDVFYTYETGHNTWNQYGAVQDADGDCVEFDAPLQFLYTHTTAADRNGDDTYDGSSYFLEYGGNGDLWGIPFEGEDLKGEGDFDRWYPIFGIVDGTLMGPDGTEYVVRAIEMEQTLQEDPGAAPDLDISAADDLVLPTGANYATPDMTAKPVVTDPPAVINGEVQVR
jgi:hypothetical protein